MGDLKKIEGGKKATPVERRVVLTGQQVYDLWNLCKVAVAGGNRAIERRIEAAETMLGAICKADFDPETGAQSYVVPRERSEYLFGDLELYGLKVAIAQAIAGGPNRTPADHGTKKYVLLPLAKKLGVLKAVEKDTKVEGNEPELDMELDDDRSPEATPADEKPAEAPAQG